MAENRKRTLSLTFTRPLTWLSSAVSELDTVTSSQKSSESGNLEKELVEESAETRRRADDAPLFLAAITASFPTLSPPLPSPPFLLLLHPHH